MTQNQGYLDFGEYIRQGEPSKREAAYAWSTAIGLQAVDGLKTSEYLNELARRNIEGEITMDEVSKLLDSYYERKTIREADDDDKEEADKAIWQIHAFGEGNTRTTAVFTIQYLRSLGFDVDNDLFAKHSWYFRNALVRANYSNYQKKITADTSFLENFFRNLLMGENNELKNRFMVIDPPKEWGLQAKGQDKQGTCEEQAEEQAEDKHRTSTEQVPNKYRTSTEQVPEQVRVILMAVGKDRLTLKQLMDKMELKHRPNFIEQYLNPAISEGYVRLLYPDNPHHPRQKYLLTLRGTLLYNELINLEN